MRGAGRGRRVRRQTSDTVMWRHSLDGFRTADPRQFATVVREHHVPVIDDVIDVADTPTYDTLERLLDGVSKSYR